MKKIVASLVLIGNLLYANNSAISYKYGIKDYENSKTKVDGRVQNIDISHKLLNHKFILGFQDDSVKREHFMTKAKLASLNVEKYSARYDYLLNKNIDLKASYIKIIDNLAPTDQGKIYGLGVSYKIFKGFKTSFDFYKSDYKNFDVNEYDISISKAFKFDNLKLKASVIGKRIDINGQKYGNYTFKDKDYFTTGVKLSANYNTYIAAIKAFYGERIFTVLNGGTRVQHHAMQQDKTYAISLGKKFKNFDIIGSYFYQNGKELPENQDDVDTKVISLLFSYKF